MKVHHKIVRAINAPKPGKVYGAKVEDLTLNGTSVTVGWAIFGHKIRAKKATKKYATPKLKSLAKGA